MFDKFEIDVLLDISAGCQRRCDDCVVSFDSPMSLSRTKDFKRLLEQCMDDFFLGNLWLGPTDIFASNQTVTYTDPEIIQVAKYFKTLTLSTSLLGRDADIARHAEEVGKHYTQEIKLAIPVNLREVDNVKYRTYIWDKINLFEKHLGRPLGTTTRKVYFIGNLPTSGDDIDPTIFDKFIKDWGVQLDIGVGNGRQGIEALRTMFDNALEFFDNRLTEVNNFPGALLEEGRGIDLLYRNGDLYFMPFYNERIAVLDDRFKLFKQQIWSVDNLISNINNLMVESMTLSQKHPECSACEFNSRCSLFLVPTLLDSLNIKHCVQPKELLRKNGTYHKAH
ncbi:MAG: hypothetical protein WCP55_03395 [Lentisphaerota bacterium]